MVTTLTSPSEEIEIHIGESKLRPKRFPWGMEVRGMKAHGHGLPDLFAAMQLFISRLRAAGLAHIAGELEGIMVGLDD